MQLYVSDGNSFLHLHSTHNSKSFSCFASQTIGLHELHPDGTEVLDDFGRVIQTYDNLDILSNARIFTGFTFTSRRGNIEELFRSKKSRQDPMRIEVDKHVSFIAQMLTLK